MKKREICGKKSKKLKNHVFLKNALFLKKFVEYKLYTTTYWPPATLPLPSRPAIDPPGRWPVPMYESDHTPILYAYSNSSSIL